MRTTGRVWKVCGTAILLVAALQAYAAQLIIGQVAPLSGPEASQGRAYSTGMQLYFNEVNRTGGVNGHTFLLARADDGGRSADTVSETRKLLVESRPLALAGYFGNQNISSVVSSGLLEKERIPLIGYRTNEIRDETPLVYNVRASLREEIARIAQHVATIGITRIGLFYEEGPSAAALVSAVNESVQKAGGSIIVKASYPAGSTKIGAASESLLAGAPQAIIVVASGTATSAFVEQYRSAKGAAQLFAHSGADIEQLSKRLADEHMQGIAIAQVTPSPYKISVRLTKEFNDLAARTTNLEVPISYVMMEGYINAKIIVEAVRRMGARPTREALPVALESLDNYDLGGYVVGFRPGVRTGSRFVELSIISGAGRIRQ